MENRDKFDKLFWRHRQLGQMIEALSSDKKAQQRVAREQRKIAKEMAGMLGTSNYNLIVPLPEPLKGEIKAIWRVEGTPSKRGRAAAGRWMAAIGVQWDGSINALRSEVFKALRRGDGIPDGHFEGMLVEWTIEVNDTTEYWQATWTALEESINSGRPLNIRVICD